MWGVSIVTLKGFVWSERNCLDLWFASLLCDDLPQILTASDDVATGEAGEEVWEVHTASSQPPASPVSLAVPAQAATGAAKFMPISVQLDAKNITITHSQHNILEILQLPFWTSLSPVQYAK